jgi:hypothetical protein
MKRRAKTVAVITSAAALGAGSMAAVQSATASGNTGRKAAAAIACQGLPSLTAAERGVLQQVAQAEAAQAPGIAKPILDSAVAAGTITQTQEDNFLQRLGRVRGPGEARPQRTTPPTPPSAAQIAVFKQVAAAIGARLPGIAKPILDKAVGDGTITAAQEKQLLNFFTAGPHAGRPFKLGLRPRAAAFAARP